MLEVKSNENSATFTYDENSSTWILECSYSFDVPNKHNGRESKRFQRVILLLVTADQKPRRNMSTRNGRWGIVKG
jgi:hypothetical protein